MENNEKENAQDETRDEHIVVSSPPESTSNNSDSNFDREIENASEALQEINLNKEENVPTSIESKTEIEGNVVKFSIGTDEDPVIVPVVVEKKINNNPIRSMEDKDKALSLLDLVEKETDVVQRVSSDSNLSSDATCILRTSAANRGANFVSFDSSTDSYQENARTSSSQSCQINENESKFLEEQANLKRLLEEAQNKCSELLDVVTKKDETIAMLHTTKGLLEREKSTLKRELDIATKEKENAVIRYATVEKNILDARTAKEQAEKRVKDATKEVEAANTRMKFAVSEKNRVCGLYDTKCQELRLSQREIERLKSDVSSLETKLKWNTTKLKTETEGKVAAEKKIEELTEELNKMKLEEISRAKEEIENEKAVVP